jgi:hypothetical protein
MSDASITLRDAAGRRRSPAHVLPDPHDRHGEIIDTVRPRRPPTISMTAGLSI